MRMPDRLTKRGAAVLAVLVWAAGAAVWGGAPAWAGQGRAEAAIGKAGSGDVMLRLAGRTPVPQPPRGKGDKCVAPTDWMRRNHMLALTHKRDETVHQGIRTPKFSLKECIACHAVKGADGKPVTVKDPRHFCRSCHDYAAVKIDCFECHASRPEPGARAMRGEAIRSSVAALESYLREREK